MHTLTHAPRQGTTVQAWIAASGVLRADGEAIAAWRKQPIEFAGQKFSATFQKHADDQGVLALRTVLKVIEREGWQEKSFANWGVLSAPHLFSRIGISKTIERYRTDGVWDVSPHLIPNQSIHAIAGTISQVLKSHGPNFGVSGGANSGPDGFLLALTLLADGTLPGLWLVLTAHEREWVPVLGQTAPAPICHCVALALTASTGDTGGMTLAIEHGRPGLCASALYPDFDLASFLAELPSGSGKWRLTDSHWLELNGEPRP